MSMKITELPLMERLAIEQALFSRLGDDVSTKNPDSLRSAMDEEIVGNYYATGAKSYDVHVNGQKVGTYSVRMSRGKQQQTKKKIVVKDPYALDSYVKEQAMDEALEYIHLVMENFACFMLENYGVVPDGCEVVEVVEQAQQPQVQGTTLRVNADKVAEAISGYLPTTVAGLLGGGADE